MRKIMAIAVATILLVFGMVMTANAAEHVYYENDFSSADSLADFTQYRGEWGIVDGQLMLTGMGDLDMSQQCFLLYTKDPGVMNLTDYVLEVDMLNIQTQAGPLLRCDITKANGSTSNAFYGYQMFLSFTGEKAAIGRADASDGWKGNLHVSGAVTHPGANLHLYCKVEGKNLTYIITDKDTGAEIFNHTLENEEWALGSFGFRAVIMNNGILNVGLLGFDNLKVTAIGEVGDWLAAGKSLADYQPGVENAAIVVAHTDAIQVTVPEVVQVESSKLDASKNEYVFYENDFSDAATISDFTQYRGEWTIKNGGLYYSAITSGFDATSNMSYILYSANHDANLLKNYTVEADICNVQTAAGIISHADLSQAASRPNGNSFYGYLSFISNDATKFAVGYCDWQGNWGGNLVVGEPMANIGGNYHIKVAYAEDGTFTTTVTAVGSDEVMWTDTQVISDWTAGSFGFRNRLALDAAINLDTAYWDNLKVTVYGEEAVLLNAGYHPNAEIVGTLDLPAETTAAPAETTAAPVETTAAPAVTTAAPVTPAVTTAAPAVTTAAPVETTVAPAVTTGDVAVTTAAPVATTEAPVVTTAAPVETTTAAPETTEAPAATSAPAATTTAPAATQTEGGANVGLIIGIVVAVVVVAAIVVVVLKKKKN